MPSHASPPSAEQQLSEQLRVAQVLQALSTRLLGEEDANTLYAAILEAGVSISNASCATLHLLETGSGGRNQRLLGMHGLDAVGAELWGGVSALSGGFTEALRRGQRCIFTPESFAAVSPSERHWYETSGLRRAEITPLLRGCGQVVGFLAAYWRHSEPLIPHVTHGFDVLARQAADYIHRTQAEGALLDVLATERAWQQSLRQLTVELEARTAAALAEHKLLADVVEATDAFVQVLDLEFNWLAINRACAAEFERIYGGRPHVGGNMLALLAERPEHQTEVREIWSRALAGEEFTAIGEFGDPAHDRRSYEMKFNVLRNADSRQIGAYQFAYDVTARLAQEKRLEHAEVASRQTQKREAIGQLTAGVAHDFNNLLMVISGGLQMLDRPALAERRHEIKQGMLQAIDRGASLTRHLLALSRHRPLQVQSLQVGSHLASMSLLLERSLGNSVRVQMNIAADLWPIEVDASEMELAVVNLCVNARDAMPMAGVIEITARNVRQFSPLNSDAVQLVVRDPGTGMSREVLRRVFDPFFSTKPIGNGSGLGLTQVYGFVKQSSGHIEIESELQRGTTVSLWFPRSSAVQAPSSEPDVAAGDLADSHVLLVEDDQQVAFVARQMLEEAGADVTAVATAQAALDTLGAGAHAVIDVVLSDVMMPGGQSGVQLAREIRRRWPTLPVVLTTGYLESARDARVEGLAVLAKPYDLEQLTGVLRTALVERRRARQH